MIVYVFCFISRIYKELKQNNILSKLLLYVAFISMLIVSGFRYGVGTDFWMYNNYFRHIQNITKESSILEYGYFVFNKLLRLISNSDQIIFLATSFIILLFIFKCVLRYSKRYELSFYLFITMYFYYSSFNITRQFIAIALSFYAVRYIFEKKCIYYMAFIFIAGLFHNSAFIMAPFYFISQLKFSNKAYIMISILAILVFLFFNQAINIVFTILPRYKKYIGSDFLTSDSNLMHFIVIAIVMIVSFILKEKLNKLDYKNNVYINAIFFATIFQLLGIKTVLFSRIVMYLSIYGIILIPNMISLFSKKIRPIVYLAVVLIYYLNCFVLMLTGNSGILPYMYRLI